VHYHFRIHKEKNKYWAECLELDGCFTQADSLPELHENMREALNLYIQEPDNSRFVAPLPDATIKKTRTVVEVPLEPHIAFAFLVRANRILRRMTQKKAAKAMGFDKLYSYQRLESAGCNPTLEILARVKRVFPEFTLDSILS
jgi:antitoxin HicB